MAWKAITAAGEQCSECGLLVPGKNVCSQCRASFDRSMDAVVCEVCGAFTPSTSARCLACGTRTGEIEIEDVEECEEDLASIIKRITREGEEARPTTHEGAQEEAPDSMVTIDLASILYQELITSLRDLDKLSDDLQGLDRLPDWRKIQKINRFWHRFRGVVETLREIHEALDSSEGHLFFEGGKFRVLERARLREERLRREIDILRKELIAREVALLMADDEFLRQLSRDINISGADAAREHHIEKDDLKVILASIERILASMPKSAFSMFAHSKEYILFEKLLERYGI